MKKLVKSIAVVLFLITGQAFINTSFAQTVAVSNSDFSAFNSTWTGKLTYLNYADDKSHFSIPCTLETFYKKGKLKTVIVYDELDKKGKKMKNKSSFSISKDGKYFLMGNDKWKIISNEKANGNLKIVATKNGKDNEQKAEMRITFVLENMKSISWKKDVRYEGTNDFFNRNQFSFSFDS